MAFRSSRPPYSSFTAILDMAKSAWDSSVPAEFTRMKISVTVSISRSSASSISPTWLLVIFRSPSSTNDTCLRSPAGLRSM